MTELVAETRIDRPAAAVWALLADYGNDPRWRRGVHTMAPEPPGPVTAGTRTAEVLRFAGRTYLNNGEVLAVEPGRSFRWRTTSGVRATGSRTVEPAGAGSCVVRLRVHIQPSGVDRLVALVFGGLLRRNLIRDLERFRVLAESNA
ncbi:SRPBCC family protein [Nocardia huaxiensis]|uniref:SRPBCC family protein n=1 Tax=Nocardia huaxiensis TaxID=2755382 RepID=A0A7D6VND1_9NOCA|nr:SRPBCC family protein [Nocardia huaxiensis]QLY33590.1 SRPBCC family protein [Nocardia huaxiensis]UFS99493.1 SRPBCC family protein [Nocardia huaxiensis]